MVLGDLAALRSFVFPAVAAPDNTEFFIHAGFDLRPLGGNSLCSHGDYRIGKAAATSPASRATGILGRYVGLVRHHSGMSGHALAGGTSGTPRGARRVFLADGDFHCAHIRRGVLSRATRLPWFFVCLFFLGLGGANFAVYTLWLPEQYPTECRASAFAFSTSFARFGGAGITFLVGSGVRHFGSIGMPVALTAIAFAIGLLLIPFGAETRGKALPT